MCPQNVVRFVRHWLPTMFAALCIVQESEIFAVLGGEHPSSRSSNYSESETGFVSEPLPYVRNSKFDNTYLSGEMARKGGKRKRIRKKR